MKNRIKSAIPWIITALTIFSAFIPQLRAQVQTFDLYPGDNLTFDIICHSAPTETPTPAPTSTATPTSTSTPTPTPSALFLPVAFMAVFPQHFEEVAAGEIDIVHEFRSVQSIAAAEDYLSQAAVHGLRVIQNMPACRAYDAGSICDGVSLWNEAQWAEFISTLAEHDNLVAWFLPDEIHNYTAAANLYAWVKTYDPQQRPVFGNPGTYDQNTIDQFPAFTDHVFTSAYPEHRDLPRALVTYAMELDANACQGTDTRWGAFLQFFPSPNNGNYPTPHEIRCDTYQAITGGATGIWYYAYAYGRELPDLHAAIQTLAQEIHTLQPVILSPDVTQTILKSILSGPSTVSGHGYTYDSIQTLQKKHHGETYLFAVSIEEQQTIVAQFGNLPAGATQVQVLFEDRTIQVTNGSFQDTFTPAQAHVYRIPTE